MKKVALFAFNGEAMCFVHVLLNALDFHAHGTEVKVIIEGSATRLVEVLGDPAQPFANLYQQVKEKGLIDCVCQACAHKMGALEAAVIQKLPVCDELKGHPSMRRYIDQGYEIITF
jgi:hypothetical protein